MPAAREFRLVTEWQLAAPRARVWAALETPREWPTWWRYVARVDALEPGDARGIGARHRFHWTSRLPYHVRFEMRLVEVEPGRRLRASASGDLHGEGLWELEDAGPGTRARYTWSVRLDRAWMRALAPLLRPVFAWNHHAVMAEGERGLRRALDAVGTPG